ncbi:MAG: nicotinate-nucleotide diphosphorylase (carboxylating), partial [candidate division Zixibacteria bacterium RBG_16_50_21]
MRFGQPVGELIRLSLKEDVGSGDVTTSLVVPAGQRASAFIYAKGSGVLAGIEVAGQVLKTIDKRIRFKPLFQDGQHIRKGYRIARIEGRAASILTAERTALNFLQRLSGVATLTWQYVQKVSGTGVKICDTRKTTPGWRELEKYAVRMGKGRNHRRGLYDQILIKDNHIKTAGSLARTLTRVKSKNAGKLSFEIEVSNASELNQALLGGADWVMLDNFSIPKLKRAILMVRMFSKINKKKVRVEVSGDVSLENVRWI